MAFLVLNTGCFLVGYFIYRGRQRSCMPRRLPREGTWARLYAGPREGLLCGGDICFRCLSYLTVTCLATKAPLHFYTLAFPPTLGQSVHERKKKNHKFLRTSWPYASPWGKQDCGCTLWTELSTPTAILCRTIVFNQAQNVLFCFCIIIFFFLIDTSCYFSDSVWHWWHAVARYLGKS